MPSRSCCHPGRMVLFLNLLFCTNFLLREDSTHGSAILVSGLITTTKMSKPKTIELSKPPGRRRETWLFFDPTPPTSGISTTKGEEACDDEDEDIWEEISTVRETAPKQENDDEILNGNDNNFFSAPNGSDQTTNLTTKRTLKLSHTRRLYTRLDGLEPYVLVSAITSTSSFEALTQGNVFSDGAFKFGLDNWLPSLLLLTCMASSVLGLYALGVFSLSILYSKAALGNKTNTQVFDDFYEKTGVYRYRAFENFLRSLVLFVVDIFLFALTYLPQDYQEIAAVGAAMVTFLCWKDWKAIIDAANPIFATENDDE